jgi:hypothetical protein
VEARFRVTRVCPDDLLLARLPASTRRAFLCCAELSAFRGSRWYLAGGTALALQAGHRQSRDLDFFLPRAEFNEISLERALSATKAWRTDLRERGTIYGTLLGAKISFIAYPFFVPSKQVLRYGNLTILNARDIAVMKIIAISQRGRKRDFVDLYWYATNREPLAKIIQRVTRQFPGKKHNLSHFLKSLTYFADAEEDPMPRLFFKESWRTMKAFFRHEVTRTAREILRLS